MRGISPHKRHPSRSQINYLEYFPADGASQDLSLCNRAVQDERQLPKCLSGERDAARLGMDDNRDHDRVREQFCLRARRTRRERYLVVSIT